MNDGTARSRLLALLPVLGVLALFLVTGLRGIDFGRHWDEDIQRRNVMHAVRTGTLLPGFYKYPSVPFVLSLATAAPCIVAETGAADSGPPCTLVLDADAVVECVRTRDYKLRTRRTFLAVSALAVLWIAFAARAAGASVWGGLFASALLGGSWELAYHARWIAPDAVVVQFTALCLAALLAARAWSRHAGAWCLLAAVAAGLAAGTKYPAGILLFAVVPASVWCAMRDGRGVGRAALSALFVFSAAYLASTPGTVLEPWRFWEDLAYEARHYRIGHWGFTVDAGVDHLALAGEWLATEFFSDHVPLAVLFASLAAVGAFAAWRESRPLFALLVLLPLAYFVYLGTNRVLFVRNLLFLAPFLVLLATFGARWTVRRLPRRAALGFASLLALGCLANGWTLIAAAEDARDRGSERLGRDLAAHLDRHPDRRYHLTRGARRALGEAGLPVPDHARHAEADADAIACIPDDLRDHLMWPANDPDGLLATLGPRAVNHRWYTTWDEPWIAVMTPALAQRVREVRWHPRNDG